MGENVGKCCQQNEYKMVVNGEKTKAQYKQNAAVRIRTGPINTSHMERWLAAAHVRVQFQPSQSGKKKKKRLEDGAGKPRKG